MNGTGAARILELLVKAGFLALLFECGRQDVRRRRVRNLSTVLLWAYALGGAYWLRTLDLALIAAWGAVTAAGVVLFALHYLGAGDVKIISGSTVFGLTAWRWPFFASFAVLAALDWLWRWRYTGRGAVPGGAAKGGAWRSEGQMPDTVPLVWLWAWASALVAIVVEVLLTAA